MATPNGRVSAPRVVEIVEMERRVAKASKCAFYDEYAAMGGEGSMTRWVEAEVPPLAQRDYVHLSFPGYARMGVGFANDLIAAAKDWKATNASLLLHYERELADAGAPESSPPRDSGPLVDAATVHEGVPLLVDASLRD